MLVGEQPGDHEDIAGKPFVGPAGDVLNDVLRETGILRDRAFVTNAVKHFKFELRGRRRLHRSPDAGEVAHCRWWLAKELELVRPRVVVALGVTAARALTGRTVTINAMRGAVHEMADGAQLVVTNHPSALLRQRNAEAARQLRGNMLADLTTARRCLEAAG
jgi:DNA polymerase